MYCSASPRLISNPPQLGIRDETLVVVTADHGHGSASLQSFRSLHPRITDSTYLFH